MHFDGSRFRCLLPIPRPFLLTSCDCEGYLCSTTSVPFCLFYRWFHVHVTHKVNTTRHITQLTQYCYEYGTHRTQQGPYRTVISVKCVFIVRAPLPVSNGNYVCALRRFVCITLTFTSFPHTDAIAYVRSTTYVGGDSHQLRSRLCPGRQGRAPCPIRPQSSVFPRHAGQ